MALTLVLFSPVRTYRQVIPCNHREETPRERKEHGGGGDRSQLRQEAKNVDLSQYI
jgi:hypothetical protein